MENYHNDILKREDPGNKFSNISYLPITLRCNCVPIGNRSDNRDYVEKYIASEIEDKSIELFRFSDQCRSRWPSVGERWIDIYIYKVISFRYDLVAESNLFMASVRGLPEPGVGTIRNWSDKLVEHFPLNLKTPVYPRTERRR